MIPTLIYQMCLLGNACNEQIIALKTQINTLNLKLQAQKEAMESLVNSISGGNQEQQDVQTQNTATNIPSGNQEQQVVQPQNTATNIQTPNNKQRILKKIKKIWG